MSRHVPAIAGRFGRAPRQKSPGDALDRESFERGDFFWVAAKRSS